MYGVLKVTCHNCNLRGKNICLTCISTAWARDEKSSWSDGKSYLDSSNSEACTGAPYSRGENRAWRHLGGILQELRLPCTCERTNYAMALGSCFKHDH